MKTQARIRIAIAASLFVFSTLPVQADTSATGSTPPAITVTCQQCGMIENIREVVQEGETTGIGTVAGGLLGGILGRQLGEDGSTLGMLLGMAGGAYAGNKFEQYRNRATRFEVVVRMDNGTQRTLTYDSRPPWQIGERVRFSEGGMVRSGQLSPGTTGHTGIAI